MDMQPQYALCILANLYMQLTRRRKRCFRSNVRLVKFENPVWITTFRNLTSQHLIWVISDAKWATSLCHDTTWFTISYDFWSGQIHFALIVLKVKSRNYILTVWVSTIICITFQNRNYSQTLSSMSFQKLKSWLNWTLIGGIKKHKIIIPKLIHDRYYLVENNLPSNANFSICILS